MKSMRRSMVLFVLAAVIAAVLVALPASAAPSDPYGGKVDASLLAVVNASGRRRRRRCTRSSTAPTSPRANADLGSAMTVRRPLGKIGGESVTIAAGSLATADRRGRRRLRHLDAEVVPTGGVTQAAARRRRRSTRTIRSSTAPSRRGSRATTARASASRSSTAARRSGRDFDNPKRLEQDRLKGQQDGARSTTRTATARSSPAIVGGYGVNGHYVGIAPNADLKAINISRPDGVRSSDVMAALLWVLANHKGKHIDVVNLSLTETTPSSYLDERDGRGRRAALARRRRRRRLGRQQGPGHDLVRACERPVRDHGRRDRHARHPHDRGRHGRRRSRRAAPRRTASPSPRSSPRAAGSAPSSRPAPFSTASRRPRREARAATPG